MKNNMDDKSLGASLRNEANAQSPTFSQELHRISTAVGVMAGVKTQTDILRIGLLEKILDLLLILNVSFSMWMKDECQSELFFGRPSQRIRAFDKPFPIIAFESG